MLSSVLEKSAVMRLWLIMISRNTTAMTSKNNHRKKHTSSPPIKVYLSFRLERLRYSKTHTSWKSSGMSSTSSWTFPSFLSLSFLELFSVKISAYQVQNLSLEPFGVILSSNESSDGSVTSHPAAYRCRTTVKSLDMEKMWWITRRTLSANGLMLCRSPVLSASGSSMITDGFRRISGSNEVCRCCNYGPCHTVFDHTWIASPQHVAHLLFRFFFWSYLIIWPLLGEWRESSE